MSNVSTGQVKTIIQHLSDGQPVIITAGALRYLLGLTANPAIPYYVPLGSRGPVDLTTIPGS